MMIQSICIIGGGNLGTSIAKGFMSLDMFTADNLVISERRPSRVEYLQSKGFNATTDSASSVVDKFDMIIVSVKPQQAGEVIEQIKPKLTSNKVLVSTVTALTLQSIEDIAGVVPIVRIMPNTAIEIQESLTCLSFKNTTKELEKELLELFDHLGKSIALPEEQLDAVTVLGACGIAFALRFIRAATQGGIEIGFSADLSLLIAAQTVKGAAQLLLENKTHPEREIDKVTTPQGITISGLNEMEHQGFSSSVIKGLLASFNKLTSK